MGGASSGSVALVGQEQASTASQVLVDVGDEDKKGVKSKRSSTGMTQEYSKMKDEFLFEMRELAKLRHPCITTVMGAGKFISCTIYSGKFRFQLLNLPLYPYCSYSP